MNGADWSDARCAVDVWIIALVYLDPTGKWNDHPLLQAWLERSYSFEFTDLSALECYLQTTYHEAYKHHEFNKLAEHKKDATRIQLRLDFGNT